jgi:hypothetical protein
MRPAYYIIIEQVSRGGSKKGWVFGGGLEAGESAGHPAADGEGERKRPDTRITKRRTD